MLLQKYAYCGGKTGAHGLTMQNVLMVDGIAVVYVQLLSMHDNRVLKVRLALSFLVH